MMKRNEMLNAVEALKAREHIDDTRLASRAWISVEQLNAFYAGKGVEERTFVRLEKLLKADAEMEQDHPGRVVRDLREHLDWTQNKLAVLAGVSLSTIRFLETGRHSTIKLDTLKQIFDAFAPHVEGLEVSALLMGKREEVRSLCQD